MLRDNAILATIAVKDLATARRFYEDTLGLQADTASEPGTVVLRSGGNMLLVYESQYAGTNRATAATWLVGDEIEPLVADLRSRGVTFEHYDMPGLKLHGDIHEGPSMKAAWFQDPDGNVLAVVAPVAVLEPPRFNA